MCELRFDHDDAWSRFHHQQNVLELALEGLSVRSIEIHTIAEADDEAFCDPAEREEFIEGWLRSQIMEREIARRFLLQSLVASIYGTFEFSIIQLFANYEKIANGQSALAHGPRIDLSANGKFSNALSSHGIELSAYPEYDRIELAKQIRDAIMHRGGLVDLDMSDRQREHLAVLISALREGWPISGRPFADSPNLLQIDIDPAFVRNLLAVCKDVVDRVRHDLLAKLNARPCASTE